MMQKHDLNENQTFKAPIFQSFRCIYWFVIGLKWGQHFVTEGSWLVTKFEQNC